MAQQQPDTDDNHSDGSGVRERDLVEAYLGDHALESTLNDAINQVVADRPDDPFLVLSTLLYARATAKRGICHVDVREVLDSTGAPTVRVRLHTGKGVFDASCSSEAQGLPDQSGGSGDVDDEQVDEYDDDDPSRPVVPLNKQRFSGRGYRKRAERATRVLTEKLVGLEPTDQVAIDSALMALESEIGRNICIAASVATCKAGARYADAPLVEYIAKLCDLPLESVCVPLPLFSVVNGGQYASNKLFVQEVFIAPTSAVSFADAYQIGATFSRALREQLDARGVGFSNVGAFGGFAPQLQTLAELFLILRAALDETRGRLEDSSAAGLAPASVSPLHIDFGIDVAASEFVLPLSSSSTSSSGGSEALGGSMRASAVATIAGGRNAGANDSSENDDDSSMRTVFTYNIDQWVPGSSGALKTSDEMLEITRNAIKELELTTVVDPFDREDIKAFAALLSVEHDQDASGAASDNTSGSNDASIDGSSSTKRLQLGGDPNCRVQIVGKALFECQGLESLHEERACNTILLHLCHFPTLSRALDAIADARRRGLAVIVGADAGQCSNAAFLAAFAVGTGVGQVKFGGLASATSIERYNELLALSDEPFAPGFVTSAYRRL